MDAAPLHDEQACAVMALVLRIATEALAAILRPFSVLRLRVLRFIPGCELNLEFVSSNSA